MTLSKPCFNTFFDKSRQLFVFYFLLLRFHKKVYEIVLFCCISFYNGNLADVHTGAGYA
jgi:hypothetical protein